MKRWLITYGCLSMGVIQAQDIHFSQVMAAPLHNSPALTGLFDGDYRLMANYRSQWGSFTIPYRSIAFAGDMILTKGLTDDDFIGAGLWAYSDEAGDIEFGTNQAMLSLAYHKGLSYSASHFISIGIQMGIAQRGFDPSKVTLDNQFDGFGFNSNIAPAEYFADPSITYLDMATGLSWYFAPDKYTSVYAGGGIFHFNDPNQSFLEDVFPLDRRYTAFVGGKFPLGDRLSIHPSGRWHRQGVLSDITLGSYFRYATNHLSKARQTAVAFGTSMRLGDAIIFSTLLEYDRVNLGLSYDLNTSSLVNASQGRGGPELSLSYIVDTPQAGRTKKLKGKPTNCPKF